MVRCRVVVGFKTRVAFATAAILKSTSFFKIASMQKPVCAITSVALQTTRVAKQTLSNGYLITKKLFKEEPFKSDDTHKEVQNKESSNKFCLKQLPEKVIKFELFKSFVL